jgi:Protein of unknown function (DUF4238)
LTACAIECSPYRAAEAGYVFLTQRIGIRVPMPSRRRNHFIPRFLLNRFASRTEGEKSWTWQVDKFRPPKELSTKDVAVGSYFYGGHVVDVESMFSVVESEYRMLLQEVDSGTDLNTKRQELSQFTWSIAARTRHIREATTDFIKNLVDLAFDYLGEEEVLNEMINNEINKAIEQHLNGLPTHQREMMGIQLSSKRVRNYLGEIAKKKLEEAKFSSILETGRNIVLEEGVNGAAKPGHVKALSKIVANKHVPDAFVASHWVRLTAEEDDFILGDACVFGVSESGDYGTLPRIGSKWKEIYFPISSTSVLVGLRENSEPSFRHSQINESSAAVSMNNFFFLVNERIQSTCQI